MAGRIDTSEFYPPFWLPEGQSQTIIGSKFARYPKIAFERQRITTPDQDFIDLDWNIPPYPTDTIEQYAFHSASVKSNTFTPSSIDTSNKNTTPIPNYTGKAFVLFHGLEGSSQSHYAQSLCHDLRLAGWAVVVAHFRGCSGEPNRLARSYFSGDIADVATVMSAIKARLPHAQWYAAGVSMGGNVLLKYLGEASPQTIFLKGAVGISAPTDLSAAGKQLGTGFFGKVVYTNYFLSSMKHKIQQKYQQFPDLIPIKEILAVKTLKAFDDIYTGPIHGFKDAEDYWRRCSAKPVLKNIHTPTLILNAKNDPFIPANSLPTVDEVSSEVLLHQPLHGGHVGFSQGRFPSHLGWLSQRVLRFFEDKQ
ncbi:YheT family hydrolase [Pelistega ratti]|uniref:YheT family hydrolase n=1 Tax=Pelistega ratti TaxID=2652177 RepID=UPI001356EB85|nr:alpha/beta fold hydrolase [Pelistega ratti]